MVSFVSKLFFLPSFRKLLLCMKESSTQTSDQLRVPFPSGHHKWPLKIVSRASEVSTKCGSAITELQRKPWQHILVIFNMVRVNQHKTKQTNNNSYLSRTAEEDDKKHGRATVKMIPHSEPWASSAASIICPTTPGWKTRQHAFHGLAFDTKYRQYYPTVKFLHGTAQDTIFTGFKPRCPHSVKRK